MLNNSETKPLQTLLFFPSVITKVFLLKHLSISFTYKIPARMHHGCGVYSRATFTNIFALKCGVYSRAA